MTKKSGRRAKPRDEAMRITVLYLSDELLDHIISFETSYYPFDDARFCAAVVREILGRMDRPAGSL